MFDAAARAQRRIRRRLAEVGRELAAAREELEVARAQLVSFDEDVEETQSRALASDNSADRRIAREAAGHAGRLDAVRVHLEERIARLQAEQDELLTKLVV